MTNHNRKHCAFKHHDLANNTSQPWDHSTKGKLWAENGKPCFTLISPFQATTLSDRVRVNTQNQIRTRSLTRKLTLRRVNTDSRTIRTITKFHQTNVTTVTTTTTAIIALAITTTIAITATAVITTTT
jgi:hypothetical protein